MIYNIKTTYMMREERSSNVNVQKWGNDRFIPDVTKQTSLTFLFGITTFGIADELLAEETLGLEAAPVEVEVISIILIGWEMNGLCFG